MFNIKKNDYNTVQFIPDCTSGSMTDRRMLARRKRKAVIAVIAVIILALFVAAAGTIIYFSMFSPAKQFMKAYQDGDYRTCTEICQENGFDSGFLNSIGKTLETDAQSTLDAYLAGEISGDEALDILDNINDISQKNFDSTIGAYISKISNREETLDLLKSAAVAMSADSITEAFEKLASAQAMAEKIDMDINDEVTEILEDNIYSIKIYCFNKFASLIRSRDYTTIRDMAAQVTDYITDSDFTAFAEAVDAVEAGTTKPLQASNEARSYAAAAQAALDDQRQNQTADQDNTEE